MQYCYCLRGYQQTQDQHRSGGRCQKRRTCNNYLALVTSTDDPYVWLYSSGAPKPSERAHKSFQAAHSTQEYTQYTTCSYTSFFFAYYRPQRDSKECFSDTSFKQDTFMTDEASAIAPVRALGEGKKKEQKLEQLSPKTGLFSSQPSIICLPPVPSFLSGLPFFAFLFFSPE